MKNARLGGRPSRADRVQGLARHGGVRSRRANRAAVSDWRIARHRRRPPSDSPRSSSVTKLNMRTLEGGGRESIAEKYMPDAPATQISNPKASSSGDGKQHPDLLVHGAAAKQKDERPAIFLHRGEWRTVWTPTPEDTKISATDHGPSVARNLLRDEAPPTPASPFRQKVRQVFRSSRRRVPRRRRSSRRGDNSASRHGRCRSR